MRGRGGRVAPAPDGRDAAQRLDRLDHGLIQQRQAVPQDVGLRRAQEQDPLADGEVRLDADADHQSWTETSQYSSLSAAMTVLEAPSGMAASSVRIRTGLKIITLPA